MTIPVPGNFAALLKHFRAATGLTQEELAERTTLSVRTISDLERGVNTKPYAYTIQRLAQGLNLDANERSRLESAARRVAPVEETDPTSPDRADERSHLPVQHSPFIGRQREVAEVVRRIQRHDVRLLTLTGPGGTGKTRLAIQVARELSHAFHDGVCFVSLAPLTDPGSVLSTIAMALGVMAGSGESVSEGLVRHLQGKRQLLILDNFEHLLPAAVSVAALLAECSQLRIMITSRAVLHLQAEHEYPVLPFPVPVPRLRPQLETVSQYDAVQFFVQRAEAVKPGFRLTQENVAAIAEICFRLDGLPLALELAAARIRVLPPQALLARLSSPLHLLNGGATDQPARQQTLRNTIDWSYSLLNESERTLCAMLSVFVGGGTFAAIEAVCNPDGTMDVLAGTTTLIEQSLLQMEGEAEPRFVMLETIREYAAERLAERGNVEECKRRHALYFTSMAEDIKSKLSNEYQNEWLTVLEADLDNVRSALSWAIAREDVEIGLRLAVALEWLWAASVRLKEGRRWLETLLAIPGHDTEWLSLRAHALRIVGRFTFVFWDHAGAVQVLEQSLALFRQVGDTQGIIDTLGWLGKSQAAQGNAERGIALYEERLALVRSSGDRSEVAQCLLDLAWAEARRNNVERVETLGEESLLIFQEVGDSSGAASVLAELGNVAHASGKASQARQLFEESLRLLRQSDWSQDIRHRLHRLAYASQEAGEYLVSRQAWEEAMSRNVGLDDRRWAAHDRCGIAQIARMQGEYRRARELYEDCLTVFDEFDDRDGIAIALIGISDVGRDQGDAATAIRYAHESLALFRALGKPFHAAFALNNLGRAASLQGDYRRAWMLLEESLQLAHEVGDRHGIAEVLTSIGIVALEHGIDDRARAAFTESLSVEGKGGVPWILAVDLEGWAACAVRAGEMERAALLLGAADALRDAMNAPVPRALESWYREHVAAARTALGDERFGALRTEGRALGWERVVERVSAGDAAALMPEQ